MADSSKKLLDNQSDSCSGTVRARCDDTYTPIDHVISAHKRETGLNLDSVVRLLLLLVDGDIQFVLETVLIIFILESYFQFSFLLYVPHVGL